MKKQLLILASVLFFAITFAQSVPQAINYQGVARNASGAESINQSLFRHDLSNSIVATKDPNKTIGVKLNSLIEREILLNRPKEVAVTIPFFNNDLAVTLERFDITPDALTLISRNLAGEDDLKIQPSIVSYKLIYNQNSIGIMNFYNGIINSSFKIDNHQYEISLFNNQYILFEASNSINASNFSCQVEESLSNINNNPVANNSFLPVCIEFALEIDYYTRQTFTSNLEATNWALAIFAGVSQLYEAQTNASISVEYIYIWNTTDPYAAYVNDASGMLNALASHWQTYNSGIARDLVHLLSKRDNTGTGGIAWLNALCSTSIGYAFSSYLNNDTTYTFPNPTYTWNLMVCTHEIGHNVGSSHTHDCVWSDDPTYGFVGPGIDDCGVVSGSSSACSPPAPAPPGGFGTIMSYCHVGGSGIVLNFHNIVVSQALDPGIANASCLSICSTDGCTDPAAYNYDPSAITDDGSCCYNAGCTDPSALNYDPAACYNDGSCTYPVYGCTDSTATNYDPTATADDGSCCYSASACDCAASCNSFFTDVSDEHITNVTFAGINNTSGGNTGGPVDYTYLTSATVLQGNTESISVSLFLSYPYTEYIYVWFDWNQNGSFADPGEYYLVAGPVTTAGPHIASISIPANAALGTTRMRVMVDYNNPVPDPCRNTTWGEAEDYCVTVTTSGLGCTDPSAFNYDPLATVDDGSCCYNAGCTDPSALNYDPVACYNDGSCVYPIYGCTDPAAYNYDLLATVDDGSCCYVAGCNDPIANNYDPLACFDDGSCTYNYGCTDSSAANYDPTATMDDGSCVYCNQNAVDTLHYTGAMQTYIVPAGITNITIEAYGAQGGSGSIVSGGFGAQMTGDFAVTPGDDLTILVGQMGVTTYNYYQGSGGGGSFVVDNSGTPLIISGGGGGAYYSSYSYGAANMDANTTTNGNHGIDGNYQTSLSNGGLSGFGGGAGGISSNSGTGGGGFFGDGGDDGVGTGGLAYVNGGYGGVPACSDGAIGGYGSGGAGDWCSMTGGGGGGGYSGGGGGYYYGCGGGGGSYNAGTNQNNTSGIQTGDGLVIISYSTQTCTGCTDPVALNYDSLALYDDGSCCYVSGCIDPIANNYDPLACFDDGSCTYNYGCTDTAAANYDPIATMDDGSCIYCNQNAVDTLNYTGAMQTYIVPAGVTSVTIEVWGAQGQNSGGSTGGNGGYVSGELAVTPGENLDIYVGGQDGFNGGGSDGSGNGYTSGNGGGASDVRQAGTALTNRVIVAGGGGGAGKGACSTQTGGGGGYPGGFGGFGDGVQGGNGTTDGGSCYGAGGCSGCCYSSLGGGGGGSYGGGAQGGYGTGVGGTAGACGGDNDDYSGGCGNFSGGGGCFGFGGNGSALSCNGGGGGGGGGWYGGGSGGANWGSGGGGGSSYLDASLTSTSFVNDINTGNGLVIISYSTQTCTGCTDPAALNYDSLALYDDGSCCYVAGCNDPIANNYDPLACFDDGSCTYNYGCTDSSAANYDPTATMDDGSCVYCNQNAVDTLSYTGAMQTYTVPAGVTSITVEAYGAQGGSDGYSGGLGAKMKGDLSVNPGDIIDILVGEEGMSGSSDGSGGGGGTFVVLQIGDVPLVIAGGGSGGSDAGTGNDGLTGNNGGDGDGWPGSGGTAGNGGLDLDNNNGTPAGGGFYTDGGCWDCWSGSQGVGKAYLNGGAGGSGGWFDGGYGGGATGWPNSSGGGAGGGYSGGGAQQHGSGNGGGGGSYNIGTNQSNTSGVQYGNGLVIISYNIQNTTGCTDPLATNYDSLAVCDDSSCVYTCDLTTTLTILNATSSSSCDGFAFVNATSSHPPINFEWFDNSGTPIATGVNFVSNLCYGLYILQTTDNMGCVVVDTFIIGDLYGCTDPLACNYDPYANIDDGSCLTAYGCMNVTACNYDATATCDDGSCLTAYGCMDALACNYDSTSTCDDGSCLTAYGCTDTTAFNYDPAATCDDGSCVAIELGCTDSTALNYYAGANTDDGSCCYVAGCTDSSMFNYDSLACYDDGSCITFIYGCTDSTAYNYYAGANIDDGSCQYCDLTFSLMVMQNSSSSACDGWAFVSASSSNGPVSYLWSDGSTQNNIIGLCSGTYTLQITDVVGCTMDTTFTIGSMYGCTDSAAYNYSPIATVDDGSCQYCDLSFSIYISPNSSPSSCDGWVAAVMIQTSNTPVTYLWSTGSTQNNIDSLCFGIYSLTVTDDVGCTVDTIFTVGNVVLGCTDSTACNYDPLANVDDGTCEWTSCATCANIAPTGLHASNVVQNRATINWDNMNDADCMVDQYRIKYRAIGSSTFTQKTMGQPVNSCLWAANNTDKLILNLTPSTQYEYQMKAWYCDGSGTSVTSAWSAMEYFTTEDDCPNVGNLTVTTSSTTQATFTWDGSNGAYSFTRIKARVDTNNGTWFNVGGLGVAYGIFTKNKNGLNPGSSYRAQARTWCDPAGGAWKSPQWTSLVYWTQPTIRLEGGNTIANLEVYPNPSKDVFNVTFTSEQVQNLKVKVLNVVGEELVSDNLQQFIGEYTKQINLTNNAKGIYFLEIETNNGVINKKLILQ